MNRPLAIVTGGRRGIGLGIAKALAAGGFDIALTGLDANGMADPALDELRALGVDAFYAQSDLADLSTHGPAVAAILDRFGRIDCLVNNAGMASVVRGDFLDLTPENYDRILATNLRGTVFFTQAVVKAMLGQTAGETYRSIINITSVSASMSSPERLDYCISKTGLATLSQGLALRLAEDGIGVFEVRPGIIRTDMTAGVADRYDRLIADGLIPMKRWGYPADIGAICAGLAGGGFAFATGSVIDADGGLSIAKL